MTYTEAQMREILAGARQKDYARIQELEREVRAIDFERSIARWAIAGVLSRNLRQQISLDALALAEARDPQRVFEYIGKHAGEAFFYAAELAFKDHARMAELLDQQRQQWAPHTSTNNEFEAHRKVYWPVP